MAFFGGYKYPKIVVLHKVTYQGRRIFWGSKYSKKLKYDISITSGTKNYDHTLLGSKHMYVRRLVKKVIF